jgi:dephospho-CoA kinase
MKLLGLTGGMGMGKSAAADLLVDLDVAVVDTDVIARQVIEPGQPAFDEVRATFGDEVVGSDGRLRRDVLARRVFADPACRQQLEAILHPRIREVWLAQAEAWRRENRPVGAVVIPLLFETNASGNFDATVCVACSSATQIDRLRPRGWTAEEVAQRIQAQLPIEKKMALASIVVWTEGSMEVHREQWRRVLRAI